MLPPRASLVAQIGHTWKPEFGEIKEEEEEEEGNDNDNDNDAKKLVGLL